MLIPPVNRNGCHWIGAGLVALLAVALGGCGGGGGGGITAAPATPAPTYVGSDTCLGCHDGEVAAVGWENSAHAGVLSHALNQVDLNGWPPPPANCSAPNIADSLVQATEPVSGTQQEVLLVRWAADCPGHAQFSMAFDANNNGRVDAGETVMPVQGTIGGVATDAGQCGQGGLLPLKAFNATGALVPVPCNANFLASGATTVHGYWQQEYLLNIGPGATKPTWVNWDTTGTPQDMLILPLAWNQRGQYWANAPDYNPTQGGTYAKVCAGCHDTGPGLSVDANGNVTTYVAGSQNIACERCHGPGSNHVASTGDQTQIINPRNLSAQAQNETCGQCHSNAVASTQPAGAFDFAWNNQATVGGGNFIPGTDSLADFAALPTYGDPQFYWAGGVFTSLDHMTFIDVIASAHNTNPNLKVTCIDCHDPHSLQGGPAQFQRQDANGNSFAFQNNGAVLRNDVMCLSCHATHGDFAGVTLDDVAGYHVSQGGAVLKNNIPWSAPVPGQSAPTTVVGNAVEAHMLAQAGMPAYFDPLGNVNGQPVGRCSSCHMMKTAWTSNFLFSGPDASGKTASVSGDVSSHIFKVADVQAASLSAQGATNWQQVMPNACGSCHENYRIGIGTAPQEHQTRASFPNSRPTTQQPMGGATGAKWKP